LQNGKTSCSLFVLSDNYEGGILRSKQVHT
jgi:hypothetical protein